VHNIKLILKRRNRYNATRCSAQQTETIQDGGVPSVVGRTQSLSMLDVDHNTAPHTAWRSVPTPSFYQQKQVRLG